MKNGEAKEAQERERRELHQWCDSMQFNAECGMHWQRQFGRLAKLLSALRAKADATTLAAKQDAGTTSAAGEPDAFPALRALTEALLTHADDYYLWRQINAAVKVMRAHRCEPPVPWPDRDFDVKLPAVLAASPVAQPDACRDALKALRRSHGVDGHSLTVGQLLIIDDALAASAQPDAGAQSMADIIERAFEALGYGDDQPSDDLAECITARLAASAQATQAVEPRQAGLDAIDARLDAVIAKGDARAERLGLRQAVEPVAWRPGVKCEPAQNFNAGKPKQADIDYWKSIGVSIEYAYSGPASTTAQEAEPARWTIIGPDGWSLSAAKPIELMVAANKHQREIDPVEAERQHQNLMESIAEERAEHERDLAELVNRFLRWPLPRTVYTDAGTGTVAPSKRPENWSASGTNLLTAAEAHAMLEFVLDCDEGDREQAYRKCKPATAQEGGEAKGVGCEP